MSQSSANQDLSRRELMKTTGGVAAVATLAGITASSVYAGEKNTIQIALVGCGGRGTGAIENALLTKQGPTKFVAMADVFEDRLNSSYRRTANNDRLKKQVDVPKERKFIGFDGYKKAMDCLNPGDVVILTTPPAFRWVQFKYAIEKKLNVFMEKPVTVDGPTTRKMLKLGQEASRADLKVGVGLMCRHCEIREELFKRIKDGQIGDVLFLRAYRQQGPIGSCFSGPKPKGISELHYQIRRFHSFLWASGGSYSDFFIHNIDECCWMKDAWPVEAKASGGRHYRGNSIDQNFDHYAVEYTFKDGTKLYLDGRNMNGCHQRFASYAHGSKGSAIISARAHTPARSRIYSGQQFEKSAETWRAKRNEPNPYQLEWEHLMAAIRNDQSYSEVERGAKASLVTSMGRMAAHTGQIITFDQMLNCEHEFAPDLEKLTLSSAAPLQADKNGKYPVPAPGIKRKREF